MDDRDALRGNSGDRDDGVARLRAVGDDAGGRAQGAAEPGGQVLAGAHRGDDWREAREAPAMAICHAAEAEDHVRSRLAHG